MVLLHSIGTDGSLETAATLAATRLRRLPATFAVGTLAIGAASNTAMGSDERRSAFVNGY